MAFTWSYSRLKNFETCPRRHWHYDIAKDIGEPETVQVADGHDAHKAFELRIRKGQALPLPLLQHEPIMQKLAALPGEIYAEQKLALTAEYKPVDFFGKGVWFRTVVDFCNINSGVAAVIDYKTGKPGPDVTQLQLMSATVMHYDRRVQRVKARLLFMNHDHAERAEFVREDLPEIWSEVLPRVANLRMAVETQEFPPKPGGLCKRYCAVVSCPYHGRGTR
jgi:hypothetical protein